MELERYLNLPRPENANVDILKWWAQHELELPLLSCLARKYLGIVITSAVSERVFSQAGKTVTDFRTKLDPENVEKIVFLKTNLPLVRLGQLQLETPEEINSRLDREKSVKPFLESSQPPSTPDRPPPSANTPGGSRKRPANDSGEAGTSGASKKFCIYGTAKPKSSQALFGGNLVDEEED